MKFITTIFSLLLISFMAATAFGTPVDATFAVVTIGSLLVSASPIINGALFNGVTIDVSEMAAELQKLIKIEPGLPKKWFYNKQVQLRQYLRPVSKVMGEYHIPISLLGGVVQGYKKDWTPMGKLHILARKLENFRLKIDYPIDTDEILGSYLGAMMFEEDKSFEQRTISQYIMNFIGERVTHDMNILMVDGVYDQSLMNTNFGFAMDGLDKVISDNLALTLAQNTQWPYFLIPGDDALDPDTNLIEEVTHFEKNIPELFKPQVKAIFMSYENAEKYALQYEDQYGTHTDYDASKGRMSRLGRKIVGLHSTKLGNKIFATIDNNLLELFDVNQEPKINSVQLEKRDIVILGEGRGGVDVGINQMFFIRTEASGAQLGLMNTEQNKLFYDNRGVYVPAGSGSGSGS